MKINDNVYLKIKELSKLIRIPVSTIQKWRREKGLPFIKIGRALRFNREEVVKWFQGQQKSTFIEDTKKGKHK